MHERLISGDNHIDLTYCPPDLWSAQAPAKWRLLVPRVEELEDGCHWFVEGHDQGSTIFPRRRARPHDGETAAGRPGKHGLSHERSTPAANAALGVHR